MIEDNKPVAGALRWEANHTFETVNAYNQPRRYHLLRFLGGGATSFVWLAHEIDKDGNELRQVALKVLKPEAEAEWRENFEDEIRVLRALWNAEEKLNDGWHAIPALHDVSLRDVSPSYLAMEYVSASGVDELAPLGEEEALLIGAQTCRVLQLLHDNDRSYKDFQLRNVRWDRQTPHIKIIDWNVVTREGEVNIEKDLARLASYLFWLRTRVRAAEIGASPRDLARLGGRVWSEGTSLACRLVLERALHPDPRKRYLRAHNLPLKNGLKPLSAMQTLGEALYQVLQWHKTDTGFLISLANSCLQQKLNDDALAAVEFGRRHLAQVPADLRSSLASSLNQIEQQAIAGCGRDALERGRRWLDARDVAKAAEAFEQAVSEATHDLEAHRWQALGSSLHSLQLEEFDRLWATKSLQKGMQALSDEEWEKAVHTFQDSHLDLAALRTDAEINRSMAQAKRLWQDLNQNDDLNIAEQLLKTLDEIATLIAQSRPKLPYLGLILQRWPDLKWWHIQAETKLSNLREARKAVREAFEDVQF
jgi:hypothetical protein